MHGELGTPLYALWANGKFLDSIQCSFVVKLNWHDDHVDESLIIPCLFPCANTFLSRPC